MRARRWWMLGGDVFVGDRGEPGPHDPEHHAAGRSRPRSMQAPVTCNGCVDAYQLVFARGSCCPPG